MSDLNAKLMELQEKLENDVLTQYEQTRRVPAKPKNLEQLVKIIDGEWEMTERIFNLAQNTHSFFNEIRALFVPQLFDNLDVSLVFPTIEALSKKIDQVKPLEENKWPLALVTSGDYIHSWQQLYAMPPQGVKINIALNVVGIKEDITAHKKDCPFYLLNCIDDVTLKSTSDLENLKNDMYRGSPLNAAEVVSLIRSTRKHTESKAFKYLALGSEYEDGKILMFDFEPASGLSLVALKPKDVPLGAKVPYAEYIIKP